MYIFFWPFLFLPVIEIIGFVTIGAKLGAGWTLVWIFGAGWLGMYLLQSRGRSAWIRAAKAQENDLFAMQDLFDGVCIFIASLLLIFPGFISDFLAVPFILAPMRHWLFNILRKNPNHVVRKYTQNTIYRRETIIEGEFKKLDDQQPDNK